MSTPLPALPIGSVLPHPCPECGGQMTLKNTKFGLAYLCGNFKNCRGSHGAHPDGRPLGRPADKATKMARKKAHEAFDKLWTGEGASMSRGDAYRHLQAIMGMNKDQAHIGNFTKGDCDRLIRLLDQNPKPAESESNPFTEPAQSWIAEVRKDRKSQFGSDERINLEMLAASKGFPVSFLQSVGLFDLPDGGVGIRYFSMTGEQILVKKRVALVAKEGSIWPQKTPLVPYFQEHLKAAQEKGNLFIVEGESDTWTLNYFNLPVLGLPGASSSSALQPEHVIGLRNIFIIREPDNGGLCVEKNVPLRLRAIGYSGNIWLVTMPKETKDPNSLYLLSPKDFLFRFQAIVKTSHRWEPPAAQPVVSRDVVKFQPSQESNLTTAIETAKRRVTIPDLWVSLNLEGKPAKSVRSPFREDANPSFSIFDNGRMWKDWATGESGDAISFLAKAKGITNKEAVFEFLEIAGVEFKENQYGRYNKIA